MKAKRILKAIKQIRKYCDMHDKCEYCQFLFIGNGTERCALDHFTSVAGQEVIEDAVRRIFR